jgi:hypothetical protein
MNRDIHDTNNDVRDIHHKLVKKWDADTIHLRRRYSFLKVGQDYGGVPCICAGLVQSARIPHSSIYIYTCVYFHLLNYLGRCSCQRATSELCTNLKYPQHAGARTSSTNSIFPAMLICVYIYTHLCVRVVRGRPPGCPGETGLGGR